MWYKPVNNNGFVFVENTFFSKYEQCLIVRRRVCHLDGYNIIIYISHWQFRQANTA